MNPLIIISITLMLLLTGCEQEQQSDNLKKAAVEITKETRSDPVESQDITLGYFVSPPHILYSEATNSVSGALYDLITKHVGPKTDIAFRFEPFPTTIPRQLDSLKKRRRYGVCLLVLVPSRLEFSVYLAKPYFTTSSTITIHKDNPIKRVTSVEDINHLVFGWAQNSYISPFMRDPSIKFDFVGVPDYHGINLKKLINHRIDAVYSPGAGSILVKLKEMNLLHQFRILSLPEKPSEYYMVFTKDSADVVNRIDTAMAELGGMEFYKRLLSDYIDLSKLDG